MPTYTKNPDGTFTEIPESPLIAAGKQALAVAAHEATPKVWHQGLAQLGAQVPTVPFFVGQAGLMAANPDAVTHLIAAAATGNPIAIAGTVAGIALNYYVISNQTKIKVITDDQIANFADSLTPAQLDAVLSRMRNADAGNTGGNANAAG